MEADQPRPEVQHRSKGQFRKQVVAKPKLLRVRKGRTLHWPRRSSRGGPQARGGPGYVVWSDDPLINTETLPKGLKDRHGLQNEDNQLHKLEPAPADAVVSGHQNKGAQAIYNELNYEKVPYGYTDPDEGFVPTNMRPSPSTQSTEVVVPPVDGEK